MFMEKSKFHEQFLKRVDQGTFLWNYFKIGQEVPEEKVFKKNCLKKKHFVTITTSVFDGIKFCEWFLKRTSKGTFLPSLVQIGPVVWEEKMFNEIIDDAWRKTQSEHQVILKAPLEHVVLRWAKKTEQSLMECQINSENEVFSKLQSRTTVTVYWLNQMVLKRIWQRRKITKDCEYTLRKR